MQSGSLDDHQPRISKWFEEVDVMWGGGGEEVTSQWCRDQDGMSARIAGTKETKDTVLFPSMDQLDTACSVQAPLEEPLQLGVIKVNA